MPNKQFLITLNDKIIPTIENAIVREEEHLQYLLNSSVEYPNRKTHILDSQFHIAFFRMRLKEYKEYYKKHKKALLG